MTVHTAKGLEFPHVFLCGMNEGMFPTKKASTIQGMEEERRLAFVAMTRAEKALYLSEAEGRNFDGSPCYPSHFLLDIDPALLSYAQKPRDGLIAEARDYIALSGHYLKEDSRRDFLSPGRRITHIIFGAASLWMWIWQRRLTPFSLTGWTRPVSFPPGPNWTSAEWSGTDRQKPVWGQSSTDIVISLYLSPSNLEVHNSDLFKAKGKNNRTARRKKNIDRVMDMTGKRKMVTASRGRGDGSSSPCASGPRASQPSAGARGERRSRGANIVFAAGGNEAGRILRQRADAGDGLKDRAHLRPVSAPV